MCRLASVLRRVPGDRDPPAVFSFPRSSVSGVICSPFGDYFVATAAHKLQHWRGFQGILALKWAYLLGLNKLNVSH
jgi:hypothetical protein